MTTKMLKCVLCGKQAMGICDKRQTLAGMPYKVQQQIEGAEAKGQRVEILACISCQKSVVCYFDDKSEIKELFFPQGYP